MSVEQATALINKAIADADFRAALEAAPIDQRRAILAEHGFGDVKLTHLAQATPASAGGELSDEEFAAIAGGGETTDDAALIVGGVAAGATIGGAAVAAAAVAA